jgi:hypothetical protein
MKNLYEQIRAQILAANLGFNAVKLWNNQFQSMEDREHEVMPFPVCYIGFDDEITYQTKNVGVQNADIKVSIWIGTEFYSDPTTNESVNLAIFDLKQAVFAVLQNFTGGGTFAALTRISENTDNNHNSYYVFKQTYSTVLVDSDGIDEINTVTGSDLVLNKELIIENYDLRTAPN